MRSADPAAFASGLGEDDQAPSAEAALEGGHKSLLPQVSYTLQHRILTFILTDGWFRGNFDVTIAHAIAALGLRRAWTAAYRSP